MDSELFEACCFDGRYPKSFDPTLDRTKAWLIDNNTAVMAVLLLVFGVNLFGDGLQVLL